MSIQNLEYMLLSNHLSESSMYMPRVINQKTIEFEDLLVEMEDNTAIRKQDLRLGVTQLFGAIADNLARGLKVATPLGVFRTTIKGSFQSLTEDFRPSGEENNHDIKITWKPSKELKSTVLPRIRTQRVMENSIKYPKVIQFYNASVNEEGPFHSGDVIRMEGIHLSIDQGREDEGVFWINQGGESVKTSSVLHNTASVLLLQIPRLPAGEYRVNIATRLGNHDLRVSSLDEGITLS